MIYVFDVKRASSPFVNKFVKQFNHKTYNNKEGEGEKFYNFSWPDWDGDIPKDCQVVFQGLLRGTREIYEKCKELGRDFYYLDQPYFFMSSYKEHPAFNDRWYRIIKNNTQKNYIDKTPRNKRRYERLVDRIKNFPSALDEITLKPWRYEGKHILVIPPSYHTAKWYDLDRHDWERYYVNELKKHTKREIRVRHKYKDNADDITQAKKNGKDLYDDLKDAHAIVSFHSMCASQAVVYGVPSFCSEHSPAWPVSLSLKELDQIEDPLYSGERQQWLWSLVGSQFTEVEMSSGNAYRYLNGENT